MPKIYLDFSEVSNLDMNVLMKAAKKHYKIRSKNKRILKKVFKKYIVYLIAKQVGYSKADEL